MATSMETQYSQYTNYETQTPFYGNEFYPQTTGAYQGQVQVAWNGHGFYAGVASQAAWNDQWNEVVYGPPPSAALESAMAVLNTEAQQQREMGAQGYQDEKGTFRRMYYVHWDTKMGQMTGKGYKHFKNIYHWTQNKGFGWLRMEKVENCPTQGQFAVDIMAETVEGMNFAMNKLNDRENLLEFEGWRTKNHATAKHSRQVKQAAEEAAAAQAERDRIAAETWEYRNEELYSESESGETADSTPTAKPPPPSSPPPEVEFEGLDLAAIPECPSGWDRHAKAAESDSSDNEADNEASGSDSESTGCGVARSVVLSDSDSSESNAIIPISSDSSDSASETDRASTPAAESECAGSNTAAVWDGDLPPGKTSGPAIVWSELPVEEQASAGVRSTTRRPSQETLTAFPYSSMAGYAPGPVTYQAGQMCQDGSGACWYPMYAADENGAQYIAYWMPAAVPTTQVQAYPQVVQS